MQSQSSLSVSQFQGNEDDSGVNERMPSIIDWGNAYDINDYLQSQQKQAQITNKSLIEQAKQR